MSQPVTNACEQPQTPDQVREAIAKLADEMLAEATSAPATATAIERALKARMTMIDHDQLPPGIAGDFARELGEMCPAPRISLTVPAFLAIASMLFGRRVKDGDSPVNLMMLTAAPTYAGKSRMVSVLTAALHSAQVGWDADLNDMTKRIAASGINGRARLLSATPFMTAGHLHSELVRTGSQCFLVDEFRATCGAICEDDKLSGYLTRAWAAGTATGTLAQIDRRMGAVGDPSGALEVCNPNLTVWGLLDIGDLPMLGSDFWDRWLVMRDDVSPLAADDVRSPWSCRAAFSPPLAELLRAWMVSADAFDALHAAAAIQDPEGKRPPLTPPAALADLQRHHVAMEWAPAALGELSGLTGRALTLARRIACLVEHANGAHIVEPAAARWAADFVRHWLDRRTGRRATPSYEEFTVLRSLTDAEEAIRRDALERLVGTKLMMKPAAVHQLVNELIEEGAIGQTEVGIRSYVVPIRSHPFWRKIGS